MGVPARDRAKRELTKQALLRLSNGEPWTRQGLFNDPPSVMGGMQGWQRPILLRLLGEGVLVQLGNNRRSTTYQLADDASVDSYVDDDRTLTSLIWGTTTYIDPPADDAAHAAAVEEPQEEPADDPDVIQILGATLKLAVPTAAAVADIQKRVRSIEDSLNTMMTKLEPLWK